MQRKPLPLLTLRAGALACAALLASAVPAAELGDVAVRSFIGQQLAADIELVGLTPEEMTGLPVRLASTDVYSGANVTPDPVLSSLRLSVVKRDQRWFLHMTTLRQVDANHLYLYLELGSGEHQVVREATVWLAPDPHPAPPPPPLVVAAPEVPAKTVANLPPKAVAKIAPKALPAVSAVAPKAAPVVSADVAKPDAALIAAIARARHPPVQTRAAEAPAHSSDAAGATDAAASAPAAAHASAKEAATPAASAAKPSGGRDLAKPSVLPLSPAEAAPASCPVKPLRLAAKECIVLDSHSIVIANKIDELEDKVRVLQTALEGPPPAPKGVPSPGTPSSARAAGHAGLPKLKYHDKKDKPVEHGLKTSVLAAGGLAALALLAGVLFWLRKRKASQGRGPLKIWQSWRKKGSDTPGAALPEATPEEFLEPQ
jgi:pilus assembly protein FimV